jgi:transposase
MDRQTLRDWVHRYNDEGLDGLSDRRAPGPSPRLSAEQGAELARIVEAGPDQAKPPTASCAGGGWTCNG